MRSRYAQMTEQEREEYKKKYRLKYHLKKTLEKEEKKETKKITSFKEITPEIQQSLAYFQNRRPSKEELEKLSEQTGIFWLTIRKWFQKMRDREKYGIGEFRKPEDQMITSVMSKRFLEIFEVYPNPPKEIIEMLIQETGLSASGILSAVCPMGKNQGLFRIADKSNGSSGRNPGLLMDRSLPNGAKL
uniref:Homeobox domain-containing protein n=1 Tax=Acrobeloides nanus TaxID=290746 RepID=A0A914D8D2_9BILA